MRSLYHIHMFEITNIVPIVLVKCSMLKCTFVFKCVHHFHVFVRVHEIEMQACKISKKYFYLIDRNNLFNGQELVTVGAHLYRRSQFPRHAPGKKMIAICTNTREHKEDEFSVSLSVIDGEV